MLAIKKRHKAVKVITAGSITFAVGLTGAAAYIDRSLQHENFAFNKEQTTPETTPQSTPTASPATAENVQAASTGNGTAMPQTAGSTRALAPAPTPVASAAPSPTAASATPSTSTVTPTPGRGGGSESPDPDKEENLDLVDQVLNVLPSL